MINLGGATKYALTSWLFIATTAPHRGVLGAIDSNRNEGGYLAEESETQEERDLLVLIDLPGACEFPCCTADSDCGGGDCFCDTSYPGANDGEGHCACPMAPPEPACDFPCCTSDSDCGGGDCFCDTSYPGSNDGEGHCACPMASDQPIVQMVPQGVVEVYVHGDAGDVDGNGIVSVIANHAEPLSYSWNLQGCDPAVYLTGSDASSVQLGILQPGSVNNIIDPDSTMTAVGCKSYTPLSRAIDQNTKKWNCDKDGAGAPGFKVVPSHGMSSIVGRLRVYSSNKCVGCDPVTYKLEGRMSSSEAWATIGEGDLPWKDVTPPRNAQNKPISSTYLSADPDFESTEVSVNSEGVPYLEYKLTFPNTRQEPSWKDKMQLSEVELVGVVLDSNANDFAVADCGLSCEVCDAFGACTEVSTSIVARTSSDTVIPQQFECVPLKNDPAKGYSLITKGDATTAAKNVYTKMYVGGTLSNPSSSTVAVNGQVHYGKMQSPIRMNFNGGKTQLGPLDTHPVDFEYYEWLATHILPGQYDNGRKVIVVDEPKGSCYNMYDFLGSGAQGENNGRTLIVFTFSNDICLTKTHDGRQFGPSVLAPFSEVTLTNSGYADGIIIARKFTTVKGGSTGSEQQLHGDTYDG